MNRKIIIIDVGNMTMKEAEAIVLAVCGFPQKKRRVFVEFIETIGTAASFGAFI